jgi:hypothetical protein
VVGSREATLSSVIKKKNLKNLLANFSNFHRKRRRADVVGVRQATLLAGGKFHNKKVIIKK